MDVSPDRAPSPVELWEMFRSYLRQELLDPLRGTGRYLVFGLLGSVFLAIGVVLLALGVLRATQTAAVFEDRGADMVPYLITLLFVVTVVAVVVARIPRDSLHGRDR